MVTIHLINVSFYRDRCFLFIILYKRYHYNVVICNVI